MLVGAKEITMQDARVQSSTKRERLGSLGVTKDGRVFRYGRAGASDLAVGKITVNADLLANHTNVVVSQAAAIGDTLVKATLGATAATEDQYVGGLLTINDATGEGISYRIKGNSAADASGVISVYLAEPLIVALVASTSEVTLKKNPWDGLVISVTDQADQCMGVPNITVTAAYYAWFQTRGECAVWADENVVKGQALTIGTGTAGAVEAQDAAGEPQIGVASEALVDTEYRPVYLQID